jgi:hypothetical protein
MKSNTAKELYALIHTLTPHEKRYFKLYANFSGKRADNNYLHLFGVLHDLESWSDEFLEKAIAEAPYRKHLPSTIFHLFQLILRSLKSFQSTATERSRLREQLDFARILFEKARFKTAQRMLRRIQKKAIALEAQLILLESLQLEKELLFQTQSKKLYEEIEGVAAQEQEVLDELKSEFTLSMLAYKHKALRLQKNEARNARDQARFGEIMSHPMLTGDVPETGFAARRHWLGMQGANAFLKRDYEGTYQFYGQIMADTETHPQLIEELPGEYIRHLTDYLNACVYSKRWIEADRVMQKLAGVAVRTPQEELNLLNLSAYTQLFYCVNTGQYEAGVRVAGQIRTLLDQHEKSVPVNRRLSYFYNLTIFFFLHEEYGQALKWLNRILQFQSSDLRQNLQDFARVFQLVLHYELGNHDLAEYLFRSTYRYYRHKSDKDQPEAETHENAGNEKAVDLLDYETILFRFFRRLIFSGEPMENLAPDLYESLWTLARNPDGREPAGLYELIFWVQSKSEKVPLQDVYRQRVAQRMELVEEIEKGGDDEVIKALEKKETK